MRKIILSALLLAALAVLPFTGPSLPPRPAPAFVPTADEREKLAFYRQPEQWFIEHLAGPREVIDGQTLDPKLQYMMEQLRPHRWLINHGISLIFSTPAGRRWLRGGADREWQLYTRVTDPMRSVEDRVIPGRDGGIAVRIYHPETATAGPLPILVYHHGGGWIFASVAAMDRVVRLIANEARAIVVSVDYRLAPEHPYPAASDDGEDAFLWARAHAAALGGSADLVAVGGDSAGGHVAINIAQRQLAAGKPLPRALLLYYPGTGMPSADRSYALFGRGYGLDAAFIEFILPLVFPGMRESDARDDLMDPLRARSLAGFPPTIIATAGFDILRDSGRAFARRLDHEGVPVAYFNYASLTHSFLQFSGVIDDADQAASGTARLFGHVARDPARLAQRPLPMAPEALAQAR